MSANPTDALPVVVIGAGPVGLAVAATLLREGVPAAMLEANGSLAGAMRRRTASGPVPP